MHFGNFDAIAWLYDALARLVFGQTLHRAQVHYVGQVPLGAHVLVLGGGTGRLLAHLLTARRPQRVHYVEASASMLGRARRRVAGHPLAGCVTYQHGTAPAPATTFDGLLLPFVLDLYAPTTLRPWLTTLDGALRPGGCVLVTDFDRPRTGAQRGLLWLMYRFFRLTARIEARQLPDWPALLTETGWQRTATQLFWRGFIRADVWQKPLQQPLE